MWHDVITVTCESDYKLRLTFDDGKSGVLDCRSLIERGGVFARLRDPEFFRTAKVNEELGVVTWNDDIDIAPETAYSLATGSPLPEWMQTGTSSQPE